MKTDVYQYRDYKRYLNDLIESSPSGGRGKKRALAEEIGCQVSYVSSVLSGNSHFNHEQTEASARFFGLSAKETEFLLLLVSFNRAGTTALRNFYEKLLSEKQESNSTLKTRLKMPDQLRSELEAKYYSTWIYGAVHVLVSIPQYQTREAISKKLGLNLSKVDEVLEFLSNADLIRKEGLKFIISRATIHLSNTSALVAKHHANWRVKALSNLDQGDNNDFHYSSVVSISKSDFPRVRERLTQTLSEVLGVIKESKEEECAVLCLDFFNL